MNIWNFNGVLDLVLFCLFYLSKLSGTVLIRISISLCGSGSETLYRRVLHILYANKKILHYRERYCTGVKDDTGMLESCIIWILRNHTVCQVRNIFCRFMKTWQSMFCNKWDRNFVKENTSRGSFTKKCCWITIWEISLDSVKKCPNSKIFIHRIKL